jgi:hypothetical protein
MIFFRGPGSGRSRRHRGFAFASAATVVVVSGGIATVFLAAGVVVFAPVVREYVQLGALFFG